ncbi:copper chaperone PCu(A)C [Saccharomonospora sp. NPDC046836]|uniref:copper chaperone PCu(A)C n=1 Tax=Saccharomonospora sp. NPDC046836 TaxID=3156921 RepID=UPI0033CC10A8
MKRRMLGSAGLGLAVALLITGCGAGQITQTDTQEAAINGASAQAGTIAIRDAELAFPEGIQPPAYLQGSNAEVFMSIVNQGGRVDELVSASSDAATNVTIQGERSLPGGASLAISPAAPTAGRQLHGEIVIEGLRRELRPGQTIVATLNFRDAGAVEVELPIMSPHEPRTSGGQGEGGH